MKKIVDAKDKDLLEETMKLSSFIHSGTTSMASLLLYYLQHDTL